MYRLVIQHPDFMSKGWVEKVDLRAGSDKGRIYRVYPVGVKPRPWARLDKMTTAELVQAFDTPNGWQRDTAQMLLVHKKDPSSIPLLEKQLTHANPLVRLHAWCTLDGLGSLSGDKVDAALHTEPHPGAPAPHPPF